MLHHPANIPKSIHEPTHESMWDSYVNSHPEATLYHLSGWKHVIGKTYGHKTYYLRAVKSDKLRIVTHQGNAHNNPINPSKTTKPANTLVGLLHLVHLKHFLFGNSLISIPYFDLGGILADDKDVEAALLAEAFVLGRKLKVKKLELRHKEPLSCLANRSKLPPLINIEYSAVNSVFQDRSHKVRMLLKLPESSEILMKSFKSKLRSQIKKPIKEGLFAKTGGLELLNDFYHVFTKNMRDLGSPVHSKKLIQNVCEAFPDRSRIVIVYQDKQPMASSLVVGFKDTLENPWASALREHRRLSPNMLLYWTMLEYACDNGYKFFDFGRSSSNGGTYKFKEQWGAEPAPLAWDHVSFNSRSTDNAVSDKPKFGKAIRYWQKLPVSITKIFGPLIRKHIGL